jgi:hypothetical protein
MSNYPDDYRFPPDHDPRCDEANDETHQLGDCICADLRESDAADDGDMRRRWAKGD